MTEPLHCGEPGAPFPLPPLTWEQCDRGQSLLCTLQTGQTRTPLGGGRPWEPSRHQGTLHWVTPELGDDGTIRSLPLHPPRGQGGEEGSSHAGTVGPTGRQAGRPPGTPKKTVEAAGLFPSTVTFLKLQQAILNLHLFPQVQGEVTCHNLTNSSTGSP